MQQIELIYSVFPKKIEKIFFKSVNLKTNPIIKNYIFYDEKIKLTE